MYRLMIVDDEPVLRNGLAELVDWPKYNIQVAGVYWDGIEALEQLQRLDPHIVLTDVQMPRMNGVELSRKIRAFSSEIQIVFISGFDELEYLRNALQVQAVDYILKPLKHADLEAVLREIIRRLHETNEQKKNKQLMERKLSQSLPLLQAKHMQDFVKNGEPEFGDWQERLHLLELQFPVEGLFLMVVVSIDNRADTLGALARNAQEQAAARILQECENMIRPHAAAYYCFESGFGEYTCVMHVQDAERMEPLLKQSEALKQTIYAAVNVPASIGIGEPFRRFDLLKQYYSMISQALKQKLYHGKSSTIYAKHVEKSEENTVLPSEPNVEKLLSAIKKEGLMSEQLNPNIDQLFQRLRSGMELSLEDCRRICLRLVLDISAPYKLTHTEFIQRWEKSFWDKISKLDILDDMKDTVCIYLSELYSSILTGHCNKHHKTVSQLKRIMDAKFDGKLTIEDLAKEMYMAPNYLSTIFKQETGVTINEYMMWVRIEKAKEMILNTNKRIVDISAAVGYTDPAYFTKVFKRHTGINPSEYKTIIKP
ncbi:response regulator transcription factor [Paenibacillus thalictri]|uniref:Response regulator n=1 Tax=Paenibacillus thalictri TaxID=2527873 RepID=A0A4V2J3U6_9BACL|nr:response regulator [Paenibacillus thalictri]TBL75684.1 response regulator [Paenibacillus thalictri]